MTIKEEQKDQEVEGEVDKEEARRDTKKILIAIALIVVSVAFIISLRLFYDSGPQIEQYTYNGFVFTKQLGLWHTQWQRGNDLFNIRLRYGPRETEDVPLSISGEEINVSDKLYITFDPGEGLKYVALAAAEISLNLHQVFNQTPTGACTQNTTEACHNQPIITCYNTDEAVIYLKEAPETGLFLESNCIIIQGQGEDLVRAADKLIWIQYGIANP